MPAAPPPAREHRANPEKGTEASCVRATGMVERESAGDGFLISVFHSSEQLLHEKKGFFRKLLGQSPSPAGPHPQPGQYIREDLVQQGMPESKFLQGRERLSA